MITLDPEQTVGDFVRQKPTRARVFESLKIDYCYRPACGRSDRRFFLAGDYPIEEFCDPRKRLNFSVQVNSISTSTPLITTG